MLRKHEGIVVDPANPFAEDRLGRQQSAETLAAVVATVRQPMVLGLDSPWGTGKTTFVRMLQGLLQGNGHPCIYFNAWESDFADDPLVAFMGAIQADLSAEPPDAATYPKAKQQWKKAKKAAQVFVKHAAPIALRVATQGLVTEQMLNPGGLAEDIGKGAGELASKLVEHRIKAYEQQREALQSFRARLEDFSATLASGRDRQPPVVFFVDELDRCRPLYAVELLERVKHLFSVHGLFFVLAIDRQQLGHSLRALYGSGMNAEEYLRRFIDVDYRLPAPAADTFANLVFDRLGLEEALAGLQNRIQQVQYAKQLFPLLARLFRLSLRSQEQVIAVIVMSCRLVPRNHPLEMTFLVMLATLRVARPGLYWDYVNGLIGATRIIEALRDGGGGAITFFERLEPMTWTRLAAIVESELIDLSGRPADDAALLAEHARTANSQTDEQLARHSKIVLENHRHASQRGNAEQLRLHHARYLELTLPFRTTT